MLHLDMCRKLEAAKHNYFVPSPASSPPRPWNPQAGGHVGAEKARGSHLKSPSSENIRESKATHQSFLWSSGMLRPRRERGRACTGFARRGELTDRRARAPKRFRVAGMRRRTRRALPGKKRCQQRQPYVADDCYEY